MRVTETARQTNKVYSYFIGISEFINKWVCGDIKSIVGKVGVSALLLAFVSILLGAALK